MIEIWGLGRYLRERTPAAQLAAVMRLPTMLAICGNCAHAIF
jgi:hypothetical protein